ncbi:MAG TPA: nuclear transport factor 2 family protein [Acidimicrobiales bacterium]|jgi:ketosteroid isomerase-like protein|nr:nuclear transport factor 2 family protein [Acidimicrobiales bacterium]
MYRMIVRRIARRAYRHLSDGDYEAVLASFAPTVDFCFIGRHALGGELRGVELARGWFQRVYRLFPDLHFEPLDIIVSGPPWNTMVATRFRVEAHLPGGRPYRNEGMQFLRLRWGRVVEDRLYEDLDVLSAALHILAANGCDEAAAPPLGPIPSWVEAAFDDATPLAGMTA